MAERWIETRLWFSTFNLEYYKRLLLSFINPVVKELEKNDMLETFHFLFEPQPHFLLRLQPKIHVDFEKIEASVKQHLKEIQDFLIEKTDGELFAEYSGEITDFGEDGWDITKKVFEYGSKMAIAKLDPEFRKGRKFQEGKLLHCFLNSLEYSFDNFEAVYHLDEFIGRMLILNKRQIIDATMQEKIKSTFDKRLSEWRDKKLEIIWT